MLSFGEGGGEFLVFLENFFDPQGGLGRGDVGQGLLQLRLQIRPAGFQFLDLLLRLVEARGQVVDPLLGLARREGCHHRLRYRHRWWRRGQRLGRYSWFEIGQLLPAVIDPKLDHVRVPIGISRPEVLQLFQGRLETAISCQPLRFLEGAVTFLDQEIGIKKLVCRVRLVGLNPEREEQQTGYQ